jgi:hypothetical protein
MFWAVTLALIVSVLLPIPAEKRAGGASFCPQPAKGKKRSGNQKKTSNVLLIQGQGWNFFRQNHRLCNGPLRGREAMSSRQRGTYIHIFQN